MIIDYIVAKLVGNAAVAALVGDRVTPDALDQDSPIPAIDVRVTYTQHFDDLAINSAILQSIVTIDCFANTRKQCHELALAVMSVGWSATRNENSPEHPIASIRIQSGPDDFIEAVEAGGDDRRYGSTIALQVFWHALATK